MPRFFVNLVAPLLPALIPLILFAACATSPSRETAKACEAAERGDIPAAIEAADRAYSQFDKLTTDDLCRLAASYAVIALTNSDEQAADRFQKAYKASMKSDPEGAEKYYATLDPQMAEGLAIISGLLDGEGIYTTTSSSQADTSAVDDASVEIATEALSED